MTTMTTVILKILYLHPPSKLKICNMILYLKLYGNKFNQ